MAEDHKLFDTVEANELLEKQCELFIEAYDTHTQDDAKARKRVIKSMRDVVIDADKLE